MKSRKRTTKQRRTPKRPGRAGNSLSDWAYNFLPYEERLNQDVLGQRNAVEKVASILACHVCREKVNAEIPASRVLIVGGPSVGKSYMAEKASEILRLPKAYANCSMISPPGYRGYDTSSVIKNLIVAAGSAEKAERSSLLILDEVDKLKRRGNDEFLKQIEFSMLPILNGDPILVDSEESEAPILFSTKNTLTFAMGVFPEVNPSNWSSVEKSQKALVRYGFSEEFVSRFTHFIYMPPMSQREILNLVEREVSVASSFYRTHNHQPQVSNHEIVRLAKSMRKSRFGIRGLRTSIHEALFKQAKETAVDTYL